MVVRSRFSLAILIVMVMAVIMSMRIVATMIVSVVIVSCAFGIMASIEHDAS
jgi:hypothetical protein